MRVGLTIAVKTYLTKFNDFHCYLYAFSLSIFLQRIKWGLFAQSNIYETKSFNIRSLMLIEFPVNQTFAI